jgi:hypothetical protein
VGDRIERIWLHRDQELFVKLGGRFSRKAENTSLASAELTRSKNSWFSIFMAALTSPIEACLMSRLPAIELDPQDRAGRFGDNVAHSRLPCLPLFDCYW